MPCSGSLTVAIVAAMALGACGDNELPELCPSASVTHAKPPPFDSVRFVAHAFGSPSGLQQLEHYTESREGFEVSYRNGFRAFEIDLIELADGSVAAVHDQAESEYGIVGKKFTELTRADLEGRRWNGEYPVLFAEDIVKLLVDHPDIWLITDTKCCHEDIARTFVELAPDDSVRDRIVPHVTGYAHAAALPHIYPFPEQMYARYWWGGTDDEVLARLETYDLHDVMMWWDRDWNGDFQARAEAAGIHVWVHTPEDPHVIQDFVASDVGTYTDGYITCP
jgi:glycerophosphoryl diester phosphodiesterase